MSFFLSNEVFLVRVRRVQKDNHLRNFTSLFFLVRLEKTITCQLSFRQRL